MMIYRSQEERADPRSLLASLQALLRAFEESGFASHDLARELLIEFGALEAAAADALCRDLDSDTPLLRQLRQAALLTGDLFCKSRRGEAGGIGPACRRLGEALDRLGSLPLPGSVAVRLPEGYAYYALYPESYLEAAVRFFSEAAAGFQKRGCLRFYALRSCGKIAATLYAFAWRGRMYGYLGGFRPEMARCSPGTVLIDHVLEAAIGEKLREFDFLRGREAYKYLWGSRDRINYRLIVWHAPLPVEVRAGFR
ncbi:MAG TPA: GNAT family N-acetyltransferase [Candidatus Manganitrophaceae bacterium]|nr:GNAT family N-acetyltransferase [Candidatus Manganitrophaceae bacterium]